VDEAVEIEGLNLGARSTPRHPMPSGPDSRDAAAAGASVKSQRLTVLDHPHRQNETHGARALS